MFYEPGNEKIQIDKVFKDLPISLHLLIAVHRLT